MATFPETLGKLSKKKWPNVVLTMLENYPKSIYIDKTKGLYNSDIYLALNHKKEIG